MNIKYFIFVFVLLSGCNVIDRMHLGKTKYTAVTLIDTTAYIESCCNYITQPHAFRMQIVDYLPACECGVIACASNCVGISNGDTLRVLSLCNDDTSFRIGEIVKVLPEAAPEGMGNIHIARGYHIIGGVEQPSLYRRKFSAVWGSIKHDM